MLGRLREGDLNYYVVISRHLATKNHMAFIRHKFYLEGPNMGTFL